MSTINLIVLWEMQSFLLVATGIRRGDILLGGYSTYTRDPTYVKIVTCIG